VFTFFSKFTSVRKLKVRLNKRKLQREAKSSTSLAKNWAAHRGENQKHLRGHIARNVKNLKRAEQCLVAGNLEDAEKLWKRVKQMNFPTNGHAVAYLGKKREMLEHLPSKIVERPENVEGEDTQAPATQTEHTSFVSPVLAGHRSLLVVCDYFSL
jgi:hypothetical protein